MIWLITGIGAALFESLKRTLSKKTLEKHNHYLVAWASAFFSLLILIPYTLIQGLPKIQSNYIISLIVVGIINTITLVLIMRALQISDLSSISPIFCFSPVIVLISAIFFLGEIPTLLSTFGVLLIAIGAITININKTQNPIKNMFKDKGQLLVLLCTIFWAISSNYYKIGMQQSSPMFFILSVQAFITIALLPFIIKKIKFSKELVAIGLLGGFGSIAQWLTASLTYLVYALSIKRLSSLFSVIFGKWFFKEKNIKQKIIGTSIMLIGIIIMILFQ
jgi:drug/metabolite transporter (DMT)-like permease